MELFNEIMQYGLDILIVLLLNTWLALSVLYVFIIMCLLIFTRESVVYILDHVKYYTEYKKTISFITIVLLPFIYLYIIVRYKFNI